MARKSLLNRDIYGSYVAALTQSIGRYVPRLAEQYEPIGIYWGGGTPTALHADLLPEISEAFLPHWDLASMPFSVEATPETLTATTLRALKSIGVNRLSIGVQSFNNDTLRQMGRGHSAAAAVEAVGRARAYGFADINLDLIVSFPGETLHDAMDSLDAAIEVAPTHITTYFYNPTPNTVLLRRVMRQPDLFWNLSDHLACVTQLRERLEYAGYRNYEFFHWSLDPARWRFVSLDHYFGHQGDIFGFGAGAQSFLAPSGNLETHELTEFLANPTMMRPGKFDLAYALERSLGCRFGLNYSAMARTFGVTEDEVRYHQLTQSLARLPGVTASESGLTMRAKDYMREYVMGIHSRLGSMMTLTPKEKERLTKVF